MTYLESDLGYMGGPSFEHIAATVRFRQADQGPAVRWMRDVQERYRGDYIVPILDRPDEPSMPRTTPALVQETIDFNGMRAGSVMFMIGVPCIDPTKDTGSKSRERADRRRRALLSFHDTSNTDLVMRRFFRHIGAYATGSMVVVPEFGVDEMRPRLQIRSPLATLPAPQAAEDTRPPENIAYLTRHPAGELRRKYRALQAERGGPIQECGPDELWEMVEWVDADCIVLGVVGPVHADCTSAHDAREGGRPLWCETRRWPNRAGRTPGVIPQKVTLEGVMSAVANIIGTTDLMAKLLNLDILAQEKAIFPDMAAIGRDGRTPAIVGGRWKDGREGEMNLLDGVESIQVLNTTPSQRTQQVVDILERNARISVGLVPQAGGETYGALRTGRGLDTLTSIAVDPRIQEMHAVAEAAVPHLNKIALAMWKGYWPDRKYVLFTGMAGDTEVTEFIPSRDVEILDNVVSYSIPGADIGQTTIGLGQLYSMKAISLASLRQRHPWIPNPEAEGRRVEMEELDLALLAAIQQQIAGGQMPPIFLKTLKDARLKGEDLIDAMALADDALRKWQAQQAPEAGAPSTQPGFAAVGPAATQQAPPGVGEVGPQANQTGMMQVSRALRAG